MNVQAAAESETLVSMQEKCAALQSHMEAMKSAHAQEVHLLNDKVYRAEDTARCVPA